MTKIYKMARFVLWSVPIFILACFVWDKIDVLMDE